MKNLLGTCPLGKTGLDFCDNLALIKKAGFDATMLDWNEKDINEQVNLSRKAGLYVDNFHAPFGGLNCMWYEGEDGENYTKKILITSLSLVGLPKSCSSFRLPISS